jgi:hypothetical protein
LSSRLPFRIRFDVASGSWNQSAQGIAQVCDLATALLRDWGTGLGISLYEEAIAYLLTGNAPHEADVQVQMNGRQLGCQRFRLSAPRVALKVTAFDGSLEPFELHARRLLNHVDLQAIVWVNIGLRPVTFTTLEC